MIDYLQATKDVSLLAQPSGFISKQSHHDVHRHAHQSQKENRTEHKRVYKVANHGEGFYSFGWICTPEYQFDPDIVSTLFKRVSVERLKAVLQTGEGALSFNLDSGQLTIEQATYLKDSRLEFICSDKTVAYETCKLIEKELSLADI